MFNKVEVAMACIAVVVLVTAFVLVHDSTSVASIASQTQTASLSEGLQVVSENNDNDHNNEAVSMSENALKIDDVVVGTGEEVQPGDTVAVHYVGTFENGLEFDNSKKRGAPLEFTVGAGQVIAGWDQGLVGMRVGGERTLVIPPELGYGERGIGPIPGGATLLFTIELQEIL